MLTKMKLALAVAAPLVIGAATYAMADTGSGAAPSAEMTPQREAHHQKMLAKYDTNKDGKLDPAERAAMRNAKLTTRFEKLDANHDGAVTLDEFKAGAQLRHGRHHHHRMRGAGPAQSGVSPNGGGPTE